jgi:hypothetical protein
MYEADRSNHMDTLRLVFRFVHFLSWAAIIGGTLTQWGLPDKRVTTTARWGARLAILTGIALVIVKEIIASQGGVPVNHAKIGVKLALSRVPVVLLETGSRRGLSDNGFWGALGGSVLAVAVAVFWI